MHRRLGAPLGGKLADSAVGVLIEPKQVAHHPTVQQGAVGVGVGQVGRPEVQFLELVEDGLGRGQLVIGKGTDIQDEEGFRSPNGCYSPASLLAV